MDNETYQSWSRRHVLAHLVATVSWWEEPVDHMLLMSLLRCIKSYPKKLPLLNALVELLKIRVGQDVAILKHQDGLDHS